MPLPIVHAHAITGITDNPPTGGVGVDRWNATHSGLELLRVTADRSTTSVTPTYIDVPDLTWAIAANEVQCFRFELMVLASAATIGVFLALNGPAGFTALNAMHDAPTSATARLAVPMTAYNVVTGQPTASLATRVPAYLYGTIENGSTAGTMAVRFCAEVAGTVTVARGSYGVVWRLP